MQSLISAQTDKININGLQLWSGFLLCQAQRHACTLKVLFFGIRPLCSGHLSNWQGTMITNLFHAGCPITPEWFFSLFQSVPNRKKINQISQISQEFNLWVKQSKVEIIIIINTLWKYPLKCYSQNADFLVCKWLVYWHLNKSVMEFFFCKFMSGGRKTHLDKTTQLLIEENVQIS